MRKLIVLPIHLLVFILSIPWVICIRVDERAKWIDRKISNFELNKNKKRISKGKRSYSKLYKFSIIFIILLAIHEIYVNYSDILSYIKELYK